MTLFEYLDSLIFELGNKNDKIAFDELSTITQKCIVSELMKTEELLNTKISINTFDYTKGKIQLQFKVDSEDIGIITCSRGSNENTNYIFFNYWDYEKNIFVSAIINPEP